MRTLNSILLTIFASFLLVSCVVQKSEVKVSLKKSIKSVSVVSVVNNQVRVTGTGLSGVTSLRIQNSNINETF